MLLTDIFLVKLMNTGMDGSIRVDPRACKKQTDFPLVHMTWLPNSVLLPHRERKKLNTCVDNGPASFYWYIIPLFNTYLMRASESALSSLKESNLKGLLRCWSIILLAEAMDSALLVSFPNASVGMWFQLTENMELFGSWIKGSDYYFFPWILVV